MLEGKLVSVEEKYGLRWQLFVDCPICIASNESPFFNEAMSRRLVVVEAVEKLENAVQTILPMRRIVPRRLRLLRFRLVMMRNRVRRIRHRGIRRILRRKRMYRRTNFGRPHIVTVPTVQKVVERF